MWFSRKRGVGGLLLSWVAYWLVVATWKLGPAALAIWRATHGPDNGQNTVSVSFGNSLLNLVVSEQGKTTWSGSVHPVALALWIAGVPLALTFWWARKNRAREPERELV